MQFVLPCGRTVLIDNDDAPLLDGRNWYSDRRKHTVYAKGRKPGQRRAIYLHKLITGAARTDHQDGDGLNNQRHNLRPCTQAQNCLNALVKRPGKKFKGVYFDKRRAKWWAQIYIGRVSHFGGYHRTEKAAARAYDALATKHHGQFARLNFA